MRWIRNLLVVGLMACPAVGLHAQFFSAFYDPGLLDQPCDPMMPYFGSFAMGCMPMGYGYGYFASPGFGYFSSPSQTFYLRQYNHRYHGLNNYSGLSDLRRGVMQRGAKAMEGMKLGNGYSMHVIENHGRNGQFSTSLMARGAGGYYPIGSIGRDGRFVGATPAPGGGSELRGAVQGRGFRGGGGPSAPNGGLNGGRVAAAAGGGSGGGGFHGGGGGGGGGGSHGGGGGGGGGHR